MKKVLVLGATGAMATYLIPLLLKNNLKVVGVRLDEVSSNDENLTYIKENAKNISFLEKLLNEKFDVIVDFIVYGSEEEYRPYMDLFLSKTPQYIFLSSYRVYGPDYPITEETERLYDNLPEGYHTVYEYSIYKAVEEDMLRNTGKKNFTIIRPAITYSKNRLQLVTLEAGVHVHRILEGKTVVLPEEAMECEATMTWAGDVAEMIFGIMFNEKAMGETYTVSTAEHLKWKEIAKIYEEECGMKYITVPASDFIDIVAPDVQWPARQQLFNDRCCNRIVDNTKILKLCGMTQNQIKSIRDGIKQEFNELKKNGVQLNDYYKEVNMRMDKYIEEMVK